MNQQNKTALFSTKKNQVSRFDCPMSVVSQKGVALVTKIEFRIKQGQIAQEIKRGIYENRLKD